MTHLNSSGGYVNKDDTGNWKLTLEKTNVNISIPEKLALPIQQMLEWENNRSDSEVEQILRKINCHKVVLYLKNNISYDELISHPNPDENPDFPYTEKALALSTKEFVHVKDELELRALATTSCEVGNMYIGQIFNEGLAHSFIFARASDSDMFVCFDKAGFTENPLKHNKDFKFRVYEISKLLESPNYQNSGWRFISF